MAHKALIGKNILLISPEPWSHLFVSKHHYAIELSKYNRVIFLNPPSDELSIIKSEYENLWIVNYTPFLAGLRFLPSYLQLYLMRKKFKSIEQISKIQFDCVWSFDNSVFFDFSFLGKQVLKISHIVDYSQNFQFTKAAISANICFGVSQNIVGRLQKFNKNSFLIPHGISINSFKDIQVSLPGSNKIKAMYAGNLDSPYLDKSLLFSLIDTHNYVDFIFLGSGGAGWVQRENTFYLGVIQHEYLMSYLKKADLLLLLYDVDKFPDQLTNAHKILEYLASGKVIVSSFVSDYADKVFLFEMARQHKDLPKIFEHVILNLSMFNGEEHSMKRVDYANANTYETRLGEIESYINTLNSSDSQSQ